MPYSIGKENGAALAAAHAECPKHNLLSNPRNMSSNSLATANATPSFSEWMEQHGKVYALGLPELTYRQKVYEENIEIIQAHNAANHTWTMSANKFADMTADEFGAYYITSSIGQGSLTKHVYTYSTNIQAAIAPPPPVTNDWATPIKNSDARYSFSATGVMEDDRFKSKVEFALLPEGIDGSYRELIGDAHDSHGLNYIKTYVQLAHREF